MATRALSDDLAQQAVDAVEAHGSVTKAAEVLSLPRGTLTHRWNEGRRRGLRPFGGVPPQTEQEAVEAIPDAFPYEDAWRVWEKHIGVITSRYQGPQRRPVKQGRMRVVAAGDFHCPFQNQEAVARLIAREGPTADVLVIGGDFNDGYAVSRFTPSKRSTFEDELAGCTHTLERLSEAFPRILYLKGSNHADRYEKRIREHLSPDLVQAILYMTGGILSPDLALVKRFPNVEIASWKNGAREYPWFCVLGDVIFSHAQRSSRVPGTSLRGVHEWLTDFEHILGLPRFRAVCQFHTHTQTYFPYKSDSVLIECGAMCEVPEYSTSDRVAGRPQRTGYTTFDLVDGCIDMDSIRLVWLDEQIRRDAAA